MNKVTLSLVALATMGGVFAQAQTTEMTQEQKDQALKVKKAAIDELRIQLNKASNEISACKNADVRETYLLQLSTLEAELNEIYTNEEVYEISEEKIEEFKSGIEKPRSLHSMLRNHMMSRRH